MKRSILLTAWVSALLTMLLCLAARAEILQTAKYNGHTYHLLSAASWSASQAVAAALGGHLATINDAAENTFVLDTFGPTASAGGGKVTLWIGLNDLQNEGTFVWASGETNSYTNWSSGQPQGTASDEDFVGIFANFFDVGRWHDVVSDDRLGDVTYGVVEIGSPGLWVAGRDLAANEKPDRPSEANAVNETVPEWSYGYRSSAEGTDLTLFTPQQHHNDTGFQGAEGWSDGEVHIEANTLSQPATANLGFGPLKPLLPAQILSHPAPTKFTVVRWTAPASGRYNILARWLDLDNHGGNGISCHVVIKGVPVFSQDVANDGGVDIPLQNVDLLAGEIVDFVLGPRGGDHSFDNTGFNAAISVAPAVEMSVPGAANGTASATKGEVLGATNGTVTVTEGEDLVVGANILFENPAASVELRDNLRVVGRDDTAPYEFTLTNLESGSHSLQAVAIDQRGVEGASQKISVLVVKPGSSGAHQVAAGKHARGGAGDGETTRAAEAGTTYYAKSGGYFHDPDTWEPRGVPGPNDDAVLGFNSPSGLTLDQSATVGTLTLFTSEDLLLRVGSPDDRPVLVVKRACALLPGANLDGFTLIMSEGSQNTFSGPEFNKMVILNYGEMLSSEGIISDAQTTFTNESVVAFVPRPASNEPVLASFGEVQHNGGAINLETNTVLAAPMVAAGGLNMVAAGGLNLIGNAGGTLVGNNGNTLVGNAGNTLIGPDGASLVGMDAATLVGNAGNTSANFAAGGKPNEVQTNSPSEATATQGIVLEAGAVVTGRGNIVGNVTNRGGFIAPGSSADVIRILGDFTQEQQGSLLLEVGGTGNGTNSPLQFDQLQITGNASLGGNLIVKTIDGFTPQSGDTFAPLTYASATGNFATVTSNAQVTIGPNGMTMQVSGSNPPAPKALNIATRMRVETGDNVLIAGFIITGSQPKKVLIRGIGPSLPLSGSLADPTLSLDAGAVTNDDWRTNQEQEIIDTTIPPSSDLESAIVATLSPGPHTAILRGKGDTTGIGVVEVYDLDSGGLTQLANISTRGLVQAGDDVMIGGFILGGDYPAKVLIRAIGPSLPIPGVLQNPTLELVDKNGNRISNDNWRATQETEIIATTIPPTHDNEPAILATLVPDPYTAIVRGKDDTIGIAVVEAYNLQ